jgi:hypothetical protein
MARKMHRQATKARARGAGGLLLRWARRRKILSFLAVAVLLVNTAVPYWHAGQRLRAWATAYSELQAKHGASADLECHHAAGAAAGQQDSSRLPIQKQTCPLCKALQLFSPGAAPPVLAFFPNAPIDAIALAAPEALPFTAGYEGEHARPRAPPAA